jgi:hypothetical protein
MKKVLFLAMCLVFVFALMSSFTGCGLAISAIQTAVGESGGGGEDGGSDGTGGTLATPTGVTAIALKHTGEIKLIWQTVSGASQYMVFSSASDSDYTELTTTGNTYYTDTSISAGATRYYKVLAMNGDKTSPLSVSVNKTAVSGNYNLGDTGPGGGIIFYRTGSSGSYTYYELAPVETETSAAWGLYGRTIAGTGTTIGLGKSNTDKIIAALGTAGETGKAAQLCDSLSVNGCDDWFLPSKDELAEMYNRRSSGELYQTRYWSSSSYNASDTDKAYFQNFDDGIQYTSFTTGNTRTRELGVRAIRSFGAPSTSSSAITLTQGYWTNGELYTAGETYTYQFYATSGTTYSIQWEDSDNSTKTADIKVSASGAGISSFSGSDSMPRSVTASSTGYITITVQGHYSYSTGTYRIGYQ